MLRMCARMTLLLTVDGTNKMEKGNASVAYPTVTDSLAWGPMCVKGSSVAIPTAPPLCPKTANTANARVRARARTASVRRGLRGGIAMTRLVMVIGSMLVASRNCVLILLRFKCAPQQRWCPLMSGPPTPAKSLRSIPPCKVLPAATNSSQTVDVSTTRFASAVLSLRQPRSARPKAGSSTLSMLLLPSCCRRPCRRPPQFELCIMRSACKSARAPPANDCHPQHQDFCWSSTFPDSALFALLYIHCVVIAFFVCKGLTLVLHIYPTHFHCTRMFPPLFVARDAYPCLFICFSSCPHRVSGSFKLYMSLVYIPHQIAF